MAAGFPLRASLDEQLAQSPPSGVLGSAMLWRLPALLRNQHGLQLVPAGRWMEIPAPKASMHSYAADRRWLSLRVADISGKHGV